MPEFFVRLKQQSFSQLKKAISTDILKVILHKPLTSQRLLSVLISHAKNRWVGKLMRPVSLWVKDR